MTKKTVFITPLLKLAICSAFAWIILLQSEPHFCFVNEQMIKHKTAVKQDSLAACDAGIYADATCIEVLTCRHIQTLKRNDKLALND